MTCGSTGRGGGIEYDGGCSGGVGSCCSDSNGSSVSIGCSSSEVSDDEASDTCRVCGSFGLLLLLRSMAR